MPSTAPPGRIIRGTPKTLTLLFRIWGYAAPLEWNVTSRDIAEALGEPIQTIVNVMIAAGWSHRIRRSRNDSFGGSGEVLRASGAIVRDLLGDQWNRARA